jgi:competence protein ComEC
MQKHSSLEFKRSFFEHLAISIFCATSLIAGILFSFCHYWPLIAGIAICAGSLFLYAKRGLALCIIALFGIGYIRLQQTTYWHKKTIEQIQKNRTVIGTITSIEKAQHKQYRYAISVKISHYLNNDQINPYDIPWNLQCYSKHHPKVQVSDNIQINNATLNTKSKDSFSLFLIKEGIHATAFLPFNSISLIERPAFSLTRSIHQIRANLLENISKKCSNNTITLIASIFFGNRLSVKERYSELKELFCNWGIVHFLARSGLHMVIFILFLQLILQWIPIPFLIKQCMMICLSLLYTILSWQSISFARAFCSFLWYKVSHICGLQTDVIHIITMLSCLFLICNPMLIFFLDFQLSFGLTCILAITNHYVSKQNRYLS